MGILKDLIRGNSSKRVTDQPTEPFGFDEESALIDIQEKMDTDATSVPEKTAPISVDEAYNQDAVLEEDVHRKKIRLLIITKDESVLDENSLSYRRITDMEKYFFEIHILLINRAARKKEAEVKRISKNIWIYPVNYTKWWKCLFEALTLVKNQMVFNEVFRADMILADDPFEAGILGLYLSSKYKRPFQLHLVEDVFDEMFIAEQPHPFLYTWTVELVVKFAKSIRTESELQKQALLQLDADKKIEVLPQYFALDIWKDSIPEFDIHKHYPQFKFILLHVSSMRKNSNTENVIRGVENVLKRYPTIGLVIVGSGPLRAALERVVISLNLRNQVEFEANSEKILSYIKTANVFVHLSNDVQDDRLLLMAAVSKIPIISSASGLASELFTDLESACLCHVEDYECIANSVNLYLNKNNERTQYAMRAYETVFKRVIQDYRLYLKEYVESIERCLTDLS